MPDWHTGLFRWPCQRTLARRRVNFGILLIQGDLILKEEINRHSASRLVLCGLLVQAVARSAGRTREAQRDMIG